MTNGHTSPPLLKRKQRAARMKVKKKSPNEVRAACRVRMLSYRHGVRVRDVVVHRAALVKRWWFLHLAVGREGSESFVVVVSVIMSVPRRWGRIGWCSVEVVEIIIKFVVLGGIEG